MGEVFLARDTTARERFRREALAAASLDHPFICKVFEIGDADGPSTPGADGVAVRSGRGRLFIVMEYVAGETLHAALGRGPLSSAALLTLALELTDALEAARVGTPAYMSPEQIAGDRRAAGRAGVPAGAPAV